MDNFEKIFIKRTNSSDPDFKELVRQLDIDLWKRYPEFQDEYNLYNIQFLDQAMVIYVDNEPIACGGFKKFDGETVEWKRVFVAPHYRNAGIGARLVEELEQWGRETGYRYAVLETGKRQPEAIRLYTKKGYGIIENYGPYKGMENSLCMKKELPEKVGRLPVG